VVVVAGTVLVGHTLEYLLQQGQGPKWAEDAQHLAAACDAAGFPRFEHLLWRPLLIDASEWVQRERIQLCQVGRFAALAATADGRKHQEPLGALLKWLEHKVAEVDELVASLQELAAPT
jgi:hypothetical protein